MHSHQIGMIGYGGFGQFIHNALKALPDVTLAAVADVNPTVKPEPGIRFYSDWREMLDNKTLDIIVVVTPPATHADIAGAAMRAGKHVWIEKPLATTLEDAHTILRTHSETGQKAIVNYMQRFNPLIEYIREWNQAEYFGPLRRVVVENYAQDASLGPSHWFWDRAQSGGILVEHAVHFMDLVHFIASAKPIRVQGLRHLRNEQQEDRIMANILYDNGLMATHYHAFSRPGFFEQTTIRLVYDLAQIELLGWIPLSGHISALVNAETEPKIAALSGFQPVEKRSVRDVQDDSRPDGWGKNDDQAPDTSTIRSGGIAYNVAHLVVANFALSQSKAAVYQHCIRAVMSDFLRSIDEPGYVPRIQLEDGLDSLKLALEASADART